MWPLYAGAVLRKRAVEDMGCRHGLLGDVKERAAFDGVNARQGPRMNELAVVI